MVLDIYLTLFQVHRGRGVQNEKIIEMFGPSARRGSQMGPGKKVSLGRTQSEAIWVVLKV